MGMAADYIKAHVEESFRKMSKHCKFYEAATGVNSLRLGGSGCLYNGRTSNHCCARETCPILEEE